MRNAPRANGYGFYLTSALFLGAALLVCACHNSPVSSGQKAPEFILQNTHGQARALSGYRGRPMLINMWATWCGPCLTELPVLDLISSEYAERGLVVWAVAADEDVAAVHKFLAKNPLKFEILLDPDGSVGTKYQITGYPETFLIDRQGRIREKVIGPLPSQGGRPSPNFQARLDALVGSG